MTKKINIVNVEPKIQESESIEQSESEQYSDEDNLNSDDLVFIADEVKDEVKEEQKKTDKTQCPFCNKLVATKTLQYTHLKNCRKNPQNNPPAAPIQPSEPVMIKTKRQTNKTKVEKPKDDLNVHLENYARYVMDNFSNNNQMKQRRIQTLISQAF
jgi:hypothetical protein